MFSAIRFWRNLFSRQTASNELAAVRLKIEWFRDLLSANCKAMELIADAGEKLGGEYLFDMQYLRNLVDELELTLRRIVYDLNYMTENRYTDLITVFDRLKRQVHACLEGDVAIFEDKMVFDLSALGQEWSNVVGEKMARLGDLSTHFPSAVPKGFAISAYACWRFLKENGILERMDALFQEKPENPILLEKSCGGYTKRDSKRYSAKGYRAEHFEGCPFTFPEKVQVKTRDFLGCSQQRVG